MHNNILAVYSKALVTTTSKSKVAHFEHHDVFDVMSYHKNGDYVDVVAYRL